MVNSNDIQRLFLQAVLSRRVLSQKLAVKLWEKCVQGVQAADESLEIPFHNDRNSWDNFVSDINEALNPLDLEFAHMHDEITGKEMCVLVNRKGDEIAQVATDYSPNEIAYFKAVVEQIMLAPNESYTVSSMAALREVSSLKGTMTKAHAEVLLDSFVAKGWLAKSKKGRFSLSTRSLLELQPYLRSTYAEEITECTICMEVITRGVRCHTANCNTRLHHHCYANYKRGNSRCPACNETWKDNKLRPIGEDAFKEGQDKHTRRSRRDAEEEDEAEEEEVESQPADSQPSQPSQPRKKKAVHQEDMEIDEEDEEEKPLKTQKRKSRR